MRTGARRPARSDPSGSPGEPTASGETAEQRTGIGIEGPGGRYRILVSSHKFRSDAGTEAAELEASGISTEIIPAVLPERGRWFRIVVKGGYPSWSSASEVLDTIKQLGYEGAWIERQEQLGREERAVLQGESTTGEQPGPRGQSD
jgi:hypothetical protein